MMPMDHLFLTAADGTDFIHGTYDPGLVFLSFLVPVCLSLMALHTAHIALSTQSRSYRHVAIGMGGVALGGGIWAMHFIGMLAFTLPAPVYYDKPLTALSLLPGWAASWLALYVLSRDRLSALRLVTGGVLMGAGIGLMHYTGMMAMVTPLTMRYDPVMFGLSIVVAVALAMLALWIRFGLRRTRIDARLRFVLSGLVMGVAIAGMHYTGMAASRFLGEPGVADRSIRIGATYGALALSSLTITIGVLVAALNGLIHTRELYREVEASKSRLRAIVDTAVDAVITMDGYGTVQEFSRSAEQLFGYPAAEVVGRNVNMLMPEPYHSAHDGYLRQYRQTRERHLIGVGREVTALRKDGSEVPVRLAVGQVELPGDELLFVGMLTDISDRVALEASLRETAERAEQAASAKSFFLANMSHEIRTPMNSIIGFTELLLKTDLSPAQRGHLDTIRQSSRSLLRLLNDILDTSKLEHGHFDLEERDFSLKHLALQIESSLRLGAQARGLFLRIQYPATMPEYFRGDTLRLLQVLTNLVGNAIKFTERGGVTVDFSYEQAWVHVRVADTGIGMTPAQVAAIFDPFTQADASISRRFGGTGLGTTIARQLVQAMGGRIEVDSLPEQGSTFHVHLPLALGVRPPEAPVVNDGASLPPLRVLVADDVEQNLELLTLILQARGHQVSVARDGQQAVERFLEDRFDIVLMDVHMPGTDGLQATRQMREIERRQQRPATPVIALTASVMAHDRQQALQAGMNGFAVKPLDVPRLFEEMVRVLDGREAPAAQDWLPAPKDLYVDWARGQALWGDRSRLIRSALAFLDEAPLKYPLPSDAAPDAGEETLRFSLHGLRGAAGNLALAALSGRAADLETRLRSGDRPGVLHGLPGLRQVMQATRAALQAAATHQPDAPAAGAAPVLCSQAELPALIERLQTVLAGNELDDALLEQACAAIRARGNPDQARELQAAVESFEFVRAQDLLRRISAALAPGEPAPSEQEV